MQQKKEEFPEWKVCICDLFLKCTSSVATYLLWAQTAGAGLFMWSVDNKKNMKYSQTKPIRNYNTLWNTPNGQKVP